jgi:hypothetical protein
MYPAYMKNIIILAGELQRNMYSKLPIVISVPQEPYLSHF